MKDRAWTILFAAILLCGSLASATSPVNPLDTLLDLGGEEPRPETASRVFFEKNLGQWDSRALYRVHGSGTDAFVTSDGLVTILRASFTDASNRSQSEPVLHEGVSIHLRFEGANPNVPVVAEGRQPSSSNYFLGRDPNQWVRQAPHFDRLTVHDLYNGIDLTYYGNNEGLKYDFIVHPGADPNQVRMRFEGQDHLLLQGDDLTLETPLGPLRHDAPFTYQPGIPGEVASAYTVQRDVVGFQVGAYDPTRPLVIDPLIYSTYLGGSGSENGYGGFNVDAEGHAYVVGRTSSAGFPTTAGAFQTTYAGGFDAQVTKLDPSGTGLVYSTYIGGSDIDFGYAVATDAAGNAYLAIHTRSTDAPTTAGAHKTTLSGTSDALLVKLDPTGSSLAYSTYLGGAGEDWALGLDVGSAGNAYVTGHTRSTDFPTTLGAYQTTWGGGTDDSFVTKLDPTGSSLVYSTLLGGGNVEYASAIAVEADQAYVAGRTASTDFPTTSGAYQTTLAGGEDAFVTKLDTAGAVLEYSTYLGGSGNEVGAGLAVLDGYAFTSGDTGSTDFPTTPSAFQTGRAGGNDAYATKLNPSGTGLVYSTYLGGTGEEEWVEVAVDGIGSAHLTGHTWSTNFPTTPDAPQASKSGGSDAFLAKLDPSGTELMTSTYLGGSGNEEGRAGVGVDAVGNAYIAGYTTSTDFPTTSGAYQTTHGGGTWDVYVADIRPVVMVQARVFLGSPGCRLVPCDEHTLGFTDDITNPTGSPEFTIDYGEFDHHADLACATNCSFWMQFDITATALAPHTSGYDGTTPAAHLERWDGTAWSVVPGATVDMALTFDSATNSYQANFVDEFLFSLDAFGASSITYRLVPEPLPWDATKTWSLQLDGAQGQLVAPPVVLVHGWTAQLNPNSAKPEWLNSMETHLRSDALSRHGQDPWAWSAGNSGESDGIVSFLYDNKKDFRDVAEELHDQTRTATQGDLVAFQGPVDLVAHSMGGLVSRHFIEAHLPDEGITASTVVGKLVTMGTPHRGAKQADVYTELLDRPRYSIDRSSNHYYWGASDGRNLGVYFEYPLGEEFLGWRNWADKAPEAVNRVAMQSRMADFELKAKGNKVLKELNEVVGAPGVEYLLIAGNMEGSAIQGGNPGDGIVSIDSATLGRDPSQCFRVEDLPRSGVIIHNDLPGLEPIRSDVRRFLAGTGDSLCQTPVEADRPTRFEQIIRHSSRFINGPMPIFVSNSTLVEVARFDWTLQGHDGMSFQVLGLDGTLDTLDLELVAPDGTTSLLSGGGSLNATWHPLTSGWLDSITVETPSTLDGNWTLRALGPENYTSPLAAVPSLVTDARMDDLTDDVVPSGEQTVFQLRLTDAGVAVTGASAEVAITEPSGGGVVVALADDGEGADAVAGDGVYTGTWTEPREGSFLYEATATWPGYQRQVSGEVAITAPNEETPAGACGSPTALPHVVLESVLSLELEAVTDCAGDVVETVVP